MMDRTALLEVMARSMVVKKGAVSGAAGGGTVSDPEQTDRAREVELQLALKRMELESDRERERVRMEAEIEKEKVRAEAERKRMELEDARLQREHEAENERKRMELEDAKSQREHEWHLAQMNRTDRYQDDNGLGENGGMEEAGDVFGGNRRRSRADMLADKVKRYSIALKQVVTPMPSDASEIPQFFENLEAMFLMFEVPEDLHAKLLLPFLSDKAKYVISRLCAGELEDYGAMRDFILAKFKLTPREYKTRFDSAVKRNEETFTLFAARLRSS